MAEIWSLEQRRSNVKQDDQEWNNASLLFIFCLFFKYTLLMDISNGRLIFSEAYNSPVHPRSYKFIYFSYQSHVRVIPCGFSFLKADWLIQTEIHFFRRMLIQTLE
jgi:hypothetical protein